MIGDQSGVILNYRSICFLYPKGHILIYLDDHADPFNPSFKKYRYPSCSNSFDFTEIMKILNIILNNNGLRQSPCNTPISIGIDGVE